MAVRVFQHVLRHERASMHAGPNPLSQRRRAFSARPFERAGSRVGVAVAATCTAVSGVVAVSHLVQNGKEMCEACEGVEKIEEGPQDGTEEAEDNRDVLTRGAHALAHARRIVVLTGAGISAESGISTYRDHIEGKGLWDGARGVLGAMFFGTKLGWWTMPDVAWRLYAEKFATPCGKAHPNKGHFAVSHLARLFSRREFTLVTQNVDNLHAEAGLPEQLELHGNGERLRCIRRGHPMGRMRDYTHAPGAGETESSSNDTSSNGETTSETSGDGPKTRYTVPDQPRCMLCGSPARPDVVLFYERLPFVTMATATGAVQRLRKGDVLLVVGTTCAVAPAGSFPVVALENGAQVVEVNLDQVVHSTMEVDKASLSLPFEGMVYTLRAGKRVMYVEGKAGEVLPKLVKEVEAELERCKRAVST